jgi:transposase InsO family protein
MALSARKVRPGLVHHSDRGVQYAAKAYTELLMSYGVVISMSRRGNAYDNAKAERFMRTLKYEEVYMSDYDSLADAKQRIKLFIEGLYNRKRLHSAIGYLPPVEFEQMLLTAATP